MSNFFFEPQKYPLPDAALIADFERLVSARLPDAYRTYLETHNGAKLRHAGAPDQAPFVRVHWKPDQPMSEESAEATLHQWCCLLPDSEAPEHALASDLREKYDAFRDRIPSGCIPFLNDPGGSLFLLVLKGSMSGAVVYWDRNWEGDALDAAGRPTLFNVGMVAPSFDAFVQSIEAPPEDWAAWEAMGKPQRS
jgi:hypothetical protein